MADMAAERLGFQVPFPEEPRDPKGNRENKNDRDNQELLDGIPHVRIRRVTINPVEQSGNKRRGDGCSYYSVGKGKHTIATNRAPDYFISNKSGHRIISMTPTGPAPADALDSQPASFPWTPFANCFSSIGRAGRGKAAART